MYNMQYKPKARVFRKKLAFLVLGTNKLRVDTNPSKTVSFG